MRKLVVIFALFAWVLAACSTPAAPTATDSAALPVTGTEAPAATEMPATTVEMTLAPATDVLTSTQMPVGVETVPVETTASASALPTGAVTYTIVPEESTVTYEVGETFIQQGNVFDVAVGKTTGVAGDFQVNFDDPQSSSLSPLTVDISQFQSDSARRDNAIRDRFLQSAQFPTVTFTPTAIESLPPAIEPGVDYPLTVQGDLTIRDVTLPVTFDVTARWQNNEIRGQASNTFMMSEFGFGPISIMGMLNTEDEVKITVDFVARPK